MTDIVETGTRINVADRMRLVKNRSSGFDYLRLILSILIIGYHTVVVCYGREAEIEFWTSPIRPFWYLLVPGFFAMSGFLVTGSLLRVNNVPGFITLRMMRILPALCCEVLISAILIGPMLTELPMQLYYGSPVFLSYFLNVVGDIHYALPGVFTHNHVDWVNIQLWTIPCEFKCFVVLSIMVLIGLMRNRPLYTATVLIMSASAWYSDLNNGLLVRELRPSENLIIMCFLWGMLVHMYREYIPYNGFMFTACIIVSWWILSGTDMVYLAIFPITYITIYLGLLNPPKMFLITTGDYSYGLYLYGFPIQQAVYQGFPQFRQWQVHLPISLLLASICAYLSWHYLESKMLGKKKAALEFIYSLKPAAEEEISLTERPTGFLGDVEA